MPNYTSFILFKTPTTDLFNFHVFSRHFCKALPFQSWPRSQAACRAFHWSPGNACRGHFWGCTHLQLSRSSPLACEWQQEWSVRHINKCGGRRVVNMKWESHQGKRPHVKWFKNNVQRFNVYVLKDRWHQCQQKESVYLKGIIWWYIMFK